LNFFIKIEKNLTFFRKIKLFRNFFGKKLRKIGKNGEKLEKIELFSKKISFFSTFFGFFHTFSGQMPIIP